MPVEQSPSYTQTIGFTFNRSERYLTQPVTLMTYGAASLVLQPHGKGHARVILKHSGTNVSWPSGAGWSIPIHLLHEQYQATVTTDPNLNSMTVMWYGEKMIGHFVAGDGPAVVHPTPASPPVEPLPVVTVALVPTAAPASPMALCHSLVGKR
jgi:hypothetical protein